jgi:hypothetical protein
MVSKDITVFFIAGLLFFAMVSCNNNKDNSSFKKALNQAGTNKPELLKVIGHYKKDPLDSLKLRAARFLIENMPGHFSYDSTNLDHYRPVIDTVNSMKSRGLSLETIKGKVNLHRWIA